MSSSTNPIDHAVSRYALSVVEGREVAGDLVRLACQRHLDDLEEGADRGLFFDCNAADRVINFASFLRHTTGPAAGHPIALEPWQIFRHGSIFGWKKEGGLRRFRQAYQQVAKKNGKTTDTAPPALYALTLDGEAAPQVYASATTRDQAGLLFKEVKRMIKRSPIAVQLVRSFQHQVICPNNDGEFKTLSRDSDSADGFNPHFVVKDEVHRWTDRELGEVISNSMIARAQPIDWMITTAGADINSYCGDFRIYSERLLTGEIMDDEFFAYVAEPPKGCDPGDPEVWKMANPNLGIAIQQERLERLYAKANVITAEMPNFFRLHLNQWTSGSNSWIDPVHWMSLRKDFDWRNYAGNRAWAAIDLSNTVDMAALWFAIESGREILLFGFPFLPAGPSGFLARAKEEKKEYIAWRDEGWLEVHGGDSAAAGQGAINQRRIVDKVLEVAEVLDLQELAFDRWGMTEMIGMLEAEGIEIVSHGQGFAGMSAPMKSFEARVQNLSVAHDGNPVLAMAIGNTHRDTDPAEQIKPNKLKSRGRIDPAVAAIMALGRAVVGMGEAQNDEELWTI
ncbi:MAG: terminase TerL endonuclease subunit [Pseudomonadota bacterium]